MSTVSNDSTPAQIEMTVDTVNSDVMKAPTECWYPESQILKTTIPVSISNRSDQAEEIPMENVQKRQTDDYKSGEFY